MGGLGIDWRIKHQRRGRQRRHEIVRENPNVTLGMSGGGPDGARREKASFGVARKRE